MELKTATEFFSLMEKHIALYTELFALEDAKLQDINKNNYKALDYYVKKEEALVLRVRGMESAREKFLKENALDGLKMREIIERLPTESKAQGQEIFEKFSKIVNKVNAVNKKSMFISEIRMHNLQKAIARAEQKDEQSTGANLRNDDRPKLSKKI